MALGLIMRLPGTVKLKEFINNVSSSTSAFPVVASQMHTVKKAFKYNLFIFLIK